MPVDLPMTPPSAPARPEPAEVAGRRFRVEGMDCGACARTVEKAAAAVAGVEAAAVSFGTATLTVAGAVDDAELQAALRRVGYAAHPTTRAPALGPGFWRRPRTLATAAAALVLLATVVVHLAGVSRTVVDAGYLLAMVTGGWPIARSAVGAVRRRALDMNVLMAIAALGAVAIGELAEAAWVLVLFAVGTTLETYALSRSRRSVQAMMDLSPAQARVVAAGQERLVAVEDVVPGTLFVVKPGERVALDGVVAGGGSSVDESPITGESVPVDKQPGDEVFAGALNVHGSLTVRATKAVEDSTLARVVRLVEEAQGSRAPSERFVDRFARVYTPLVLVAALLLTVVPLVLGGDLATWGYRSLALLIVACPCSLVISVPVAVVSAVGGAARRGVLLKGGQALEDLGSVDTIAFDKTGTLTLGRPRLVTVEALAVPRGEALALMAAVELPSEHPLAAAIVREAQGSGAQPVRPASFVALPGRGVEAVVGGRSLWAGSPRLAAEHGAPVPGAVARLEARGQTTVMLGEAARVIAVFGLADEARPEAPAALRRLRDGGIGRLLMLTGDRPAVAGAIAGQVGLDEHRAQLLPEDKLDAVDELQRAGRRVAMVGDGINDAPALAAARVGVAMGAAGSDIALETADVALMGDDLTRLPDALRLSRRALRIMRANVVASLAVKAVFVVLAPFGLVTLVVAVAADMGMSLLVTLNAMRLLRRDDP